ncbi:restriction endonuclease subunit S [Lachnospiraceae bacterium ASD3451]|uniref:restriction endonuclease subunit S n=1 Tax=Diplocloster agilis TaxID=2850323 RepID=UPI001D69C280|nr:restriction endonuclease subunit S [Diplocloster agilis]MBU9744706.1 restriction endonuclease subunit S [Diplocloster agilis]
MARMKLGDICEIVTGSTPKTNVIEYWGGNIKWITPAELNDETFIITDSVRKITEVAVKKTGLSVLPKGTVILSSRAPIGKVAIAGCDLYCNQGFKNLICSNVILNEYLYWFLKGKYEYLNSLGRGATFKEISKTIVQNIEIEVPDIEKQHKIAAILKRCNDIIIKREREIEELDTLIKARFVEMFGDLEQNPKGYHTRKLGSLATKISDGVHAKPEYTETGRPFISVVNINTGKISFEGCKFVSEEAYQAMIKSTHPKRGDILYTKVGATYGIPAYVDTDTEFCLYVSVSLIKPRHEEIDSRFLALSMAMPYVKRQADSRIKGIGVPDLHLNQIREFDIICPPRSEQEEFAAFVAQTDKSKVALGYISC